MDTTGTERGDLREDDPEGRPDDLSDALEGDSWDRWWEAGDAPPYDPIARARRERFVRGGVDALVVLACAAFVFLNLHPGEILSSAVPAGGDMGAHVWGPAYLRDHLLPELRLSGWTPDWYAGFPAYQFYMVVPSLLIVALDVGVLGGPLVALPVALGAVLVGLGWRAGPGVRRWAPVGGAALVVLAGVELPYGTAFKLVTVLGLLTLPAAAYAFGRLADLPFPAPALLAVAAVAFLFDRNFTIYGGNVASTLAGEFAFSISLSLCVVYLGVVIRGLRTGRHRALAAVLLALTGLCHLIPAFYALGGTAVIAALRRPALSTLRWLGGVLPVAGLLAAFWVLPFFWQRTFVNDMGWEKLPYPDDTIWKHLIPRTPESPADLRWVLALALIGLILSVIFRLRAGVLLAVFAVGTAVVFIWLPEGRLWNARVLPFYYLSLYLLAAVGVAEVGRTLSVLAARDPERPGITGPAATAGLGLLAGLVMVGLPLRTLPFGESRADGSYSFFGLTNGPDQSSFVRSWAKWNYTGFEGKPAYAEYRDLMLTMAEVGEDRGCGRALWEYEKDINRYGTPMAPMLLPHWTDGCIGSMEGLFFESSATTPFHFLMQVELSEAPSAAQRDLPYAGFDVDLGVQHLQLMGVRYYLSTSEQATDAARAHPDLEEIATSGPWVVFEVDDAELVEPLANEPAVLEGVSDAQHDWICGRTDADGKCAGPAVEWFTHPDRWDTFLASSGPDDWQRVDPAAPAPSERPIDAVTVRDITTENDRMAFTVDRPGSPVLVKTSYFPNWHAQGADGPYRVAPNLMVVIPTEEHVELTFGREPVDWASYGLTLLGLLGLAWLVYRGPVAIRPRTPPAHLAGSHASPGSSADEVDAADDDQSDAWWVTVPTTRARPLSADPADAADPADPAGPSDEPPPGPAAPPSS